MPQELSQGNITSSTLPFTPTAADNGRFIRCRAENSLVTDGVMQDSRVLNVRCESILTAPDRARWPLSEEFCSGIQ